MQPEVSRTSRAVRVAICLAAVVAAVVVVFTVNRNSVATGRRNFLNEATASLAFAADDLGSRLDNWRTVVGIVPGPQDNFKRYIDLLVPGLDPASCVVKKAPAGLLSPRLGENFSVEFRGQNSACAVIEPKALDTFFTGLSDSFEDVVLAFGDGKVLYQAAKTGPRITNLASLTVPSTPDSQPDNRSIGAVLSGLLSKGDAASSTPAGALASVREAIARVSEKNSEESTSFSNLVSAQLAGEPFLVAVQPVPSVSMWDEARKVNHRVILAGLIRQSSIEKLSKVWPRSMTAWVILSLIIFNGIVYSISCIPMKARLQPVRAIDIAQVSFFAILCCSAATLAITHAYFTSGLNRAGKVQLQEVAGRMEDNLREELCHYYHVLEGTFRSAELAQAVAVRKGGGKQVSPCQVMKNLLVGDNKSCASKPGDLRVSAISYSYPFFDYITWHSYQGDSNAQIAKWTIRKEATPPTIMTQFEWFKESRDQKLYRLYADARHPEQRRLLGDANSRRLYVEPLRSPNTGDYLTIVSRPFEWPTTVDGGDHGKSLVGTVVAPLSSLNDPVFPSGYGFAVIRADGTVIFSSDLRQNQRENLLRDNSGSGRFAQAVRTRAPQDIHLNVGGKEVLAYLRPLDNVLEGAQWTLVVYRLPEPDEQVQVDIFLQTMKFATPYLLMMLIVGAGMWEVFRRGKGRCLFPSHERASEYEMLLFLLLPAAVFTWALLLTAARSLVYLGAFCLPLLVLVLSVTLLQKHYKLVAALGFLYPAAAILNAWYLAETTALPVYHNSFWNRALIAVGFAIAAVAMNAERIIAWLDTALHKRKWHELRKASIATKSYTLAACFGLFILSVLPTVGYYRVAYQMVYEAAIVEDLVAVTHRLEERAQKISDYYTDINLPPPEIQERSRFIQERLSLDLDRYDTWVRRDEASVDFGTHENDVPWVDEKALGLDFFSIRTPESVMRSALRSDPGIQLLHMEKWPLVQLDYKNYLLQGNGAQDQDRDERIWSYHREAALAPDIDPSRKILWMMPPALAFLVFGGVYLTVRTLLFGGFVPPPVLPEIGLDDLPNSKGSILLLGIIGSPLEKVTEIELADGRPAVDYLDLRGISSMDDFPGWPHSDPRPVLLDNFDFAFGSESAAGAHLRILERLLFSDHRPVILAAIVDPADYIAAIIASEIPDHPIAEWFRATEDRWDRVFLCFDRRRFPITEEEKSSDKQPDLARRIYASCTDAQRAVLYQISREGWVNPNNKRGLSGLILEAGSNWIRCPR